jgi:hypothetical protein
LGIEKIACLLIDVTLTNNLEKFCIVQYSESVKHTFGQSQENKRLAQSRALGCRCTDNRHALREKNERYIQQDLRKMRLRAQHIALNKL